ncbi:MAG: polymerase III, subunit gamma and tau protein [candidate division WS6 bacterium GW2011_GWF2_39_15]|uniref:DNA polymerase III subunit gamma/tau n=1 Tax=candidate division WS6 bacterium GW2011_GWF2_39_15 TaxID=1619100 RepID=A0A0G0MT51_9BACT|nr:MAG: polymerase III, subunit gamma and tau protein [candidate division WS6 bacterium GW2011_GWF2_39_15]
MSKALYNKYRSQTFDELVGQENITSILKSAVKQGKVANAYLLVGSRGTGKTSTARILAKALNCKKLAKDGNPCNECDNCNAISSGSFLDLIEIDAASNRGIDQIRELKEKLEFSPSEGQYKIYIIDEVHMLTKEAFNALLKTLEEPPKHVVFILATTDVHKLPPTILSRCQRYDFKLGTDDQIREVIKRAAGKEGVKFEDKALDVLVINAKGSYRDSLSLLDVVVSGQDGSENPKSVTEEEVRRILGMTSEAFVDSFLMALINGEAKRSLDLLYQVEKDGINITQFVKQILERLRRVLVNKITEMEKDDSELGKMDLQVINKAINDFITLDKGIRYSSFPTLSFELLVAQYAKAGANTEVKSKSVTKEEIKIEKVEVIQEDDTIEEEEPSDSAVEEPVGDSSEKGSLIVEKWSNIIQVVQSSNGPLAAILRNSQVLSVEGNSLNIQVPFAFYKERIEESKSREVLNGAIKDLIGLKFKIACIVNGAVKKKKQVSADVILASAPREESTEKKSTVSSGKPRVSKVVEEIFADM